MKKRLLTLLNLLAFITVFSQSGVGTHTPEGALDISYPNNVWGLVLPQIDQAANTKNPTGKNVKKGTVVYDLKENCIKYFNGEKWSGCIAAATANPFKLQCGSVAVNKEIIANSPVATQTTVSIPYSNMGEAFGYNEIVIQSKNVTGLKAVLSSGTIQNGSGSLVFSISGTPSANGEATFSLSIAGIDCKLVVPIASAADFIKLQCNSAIVNKDIIANSPVAAQTTVSIPYSNTGKAFGYDEIVMLSKGVTGLKAVLSSGSIQKGSGHLIFTILGTPSTYGEATFSLSIAGIDCEFIISVKNFTDVEVVPITKSTCDVSSQSNYLTINGKHIISGKEVTVYSGSIGRTTPSVAGTRCGFGIIENSYYIGSENVPHSFVITFSRPVTNIGIAFTESYISEEFIFTIDDNQPIQPIQNDGSCQQKNIIITDNKISITGPAVNNVAGNITLGGKWFTTLTIQHNGKRGGAIFGFCIDSGAAL